jgi:phasin family protein
MSFTTPDQFTAVTKSNVEAAMSLAKLMFAGAERFAPLTLNTARATLEDAANGATTVLAIKTPQDIVALQATLAQPAIEKMLAYSRSAYEIATATQGEITKLLEAQLAELNKGVSTAIDTAARNAPAGSEVGIAAVKSALAAANATYDSVNKAAKQVADMAAANLTSATDATVKAATAGVLKAKKAA